jgi:two-component system, sensor histidine kinase and response regulator
MFRNLSIKHKLVIISMSVCVAALLAASVGFVTWGLTNHRTTLIGNLAVTAEMIAENSAAVLDFDDRHAGTNMLAALRAIPSVDGACLYNSVGALFAVWAPDENSAEHFQPPPAEGTGDRIEQDHILVFHTVAQDGIESGTLFIRSDQRSVYAAFRRQLVVAVVVLVAAGLLALLLASWMQRMISGPLGHLAVTADTVARDKNYGLRAEKRGEDELGHLVDAFNGMLGTIQHRDTELRAAREHLEERVVERTTDLQVSNERLEAATEQAKQSAREAHEANGAKSRFLANMSHEIRTPMNGVMGMCGLLLDTEMTSQQQRFAETIGASGSALLTVINDILDFSRLEAGKLIFAEEDFDVNDILERSLGLLAGAADAKQVELAGSLRVGVCRRLRGDPGRLQQILNNLVGNAVKFTENGEVIVTVTPEGDHDGRAVLRFEIRDTGIGIPPDVEARLFQSFSQADASTTRKYGGSGLGLVICKQLVELMHGEIGVKSVPGQGSTFWFIVELLKQENQTLPQSLGMVELADSHLLIVDDNATNREILHHQLAGWKLRDLAVPDGPAALAALRQNAADDPFDVAILDMQMPGMDGMMLAREIKSDPVIAATRLILLTSMGSPPKREELAAVGIVTALSKPVKQSEMLECLGNLIPGGGRATSVKVPPRSATAEPLPIRTGKVLLAEDGQVNQMVATGLLQKIGYTADLAVDGAKAVAATEETDYDIILMDCHMPEMDGYEATRRIREREKIHPSTTPIYIIAMTANAMEGDREKCLAAGMNDYVSKPVQFEDFTAAFARWAAWEGTPVEVPTAPAVSAKPKPKGSLDSVVLVQLRKLAEDTDPTLLEQMMDAYRTESRTRLDKLGKAAVAADPVVLAQEGHALKGSSFSIGATEMGRLSSELEQLGKAGRVDGSVGLVEQLETEFHGVETQIAIELAA